mmetsp:Transcript_86500/g.253183  ORF Transcript_86500/g.253183 Transcript_86500/m.253183 type:complete len:103 (-) Transcript_86500:1060-1368(-)
MPCAMPAAAMLPAGAMPAAVAVPGAGAVPGIAMPCIAVLVARPGTDCCEYCCGYCTSIDGAVGMPAAPPAVATIEGTICIEGIGDAWTVGTPIAGAAIAGGR